MTPYREVVRLLTEPEFAGWRDPNPGRDRVTALEHAVQAASRAWRSGMRDEEVVMALVHDAARPLSDVHHGEVISFIMADYLPEECVRALYYHGEAQSDLIRGRTLDHRYSQAAKRLASWDASSFDPDYRSMTLEELLPVLARVMRVDEAEAAA